MAAWTWRWKSPPPSHPDVFNHNLETVPRLYKAARPGSDYQWSLTLLQKFKQMMPHIPTKSGLMLGLGETDEEVIEVMKRMREHDIDMLTLGQYLQPSRSHLPVQRFVHPDTFAWFAEEGYKMGFKNVASGPLVRSSYHADQQAKLVKGKLGFLIGVADPVLEGACPRLRYVSCYMCWLIHRNRGTPPPTFRSALVRESCV